MPKLTLAEKIVFLREEIARLKKQSETETVPTQKYLAKLIITMQKDLTRCEGIAKNILAKKKQEREHRQTHQKIQTLSKESNYPSKQPQVKKPPTNTVFEQMKETKNEPSRTE